MTEDASNPQARFDFKPGGEGEPATVSCAGDIDLTNAGEFQAALDQAAATASAVTADMTEVSTATAPPSAPCSGWPAGPG